MATAAPASPENVARATYQRDENDPGLAQRAAATNRIQLHATKKGEACKWARGIENEVTFVGTHSEVSHSHCILGTAWAPPFNVRCASGHRSAGRERPDSKERKP